MQCIQGTVTLGIELPELEAIYSSPFCAEVRNGGVHLYSPKKLHGL
jgi:hypothetical protein